MLNKNKWNIILASKSPRRKQLLTELGYEFTQVSKDIDESFPAHLPSGEVAEFLSIKKARAFENQLSDKDLLITSDTVVVHENNILGKPESKEEAFQMISGLIGKTHEVITGVCLRSIKKKVSFSVITIVEFDRLSTDQINFYIEKYRPFDKAGAYGIQEWIGMIGVKNIIGSFYNVMGLPVKELFEEIESF